MVSRPYMVVIQTHWKESKPQVPTRGRVSGMRNGIPIMDYCLCQIPTHHLGDSLLPYSLTKEIGEE